MLGNFAKSKEINNLISDLFSKYPKGFVNFFMKGDDPKRSLSTHSQMNPVVLESFSAPSSAPEHQSTRVPEHQSTRVPEYQSTRVPEH